MASRKGRGGGGSGSGGPKGGKPRKSHMSREREVSKALSWLLRHGQSEQTGVYIDEGGWAHLSEVLQYGKLKTLQVQFPEIQEVVATNDKQRFALKPIPESELEPLRPNTSLNSPLAKTNPNDPSRYLIRATQGHSLKHVRDDLMHTPILETDIDCPAVVVHGTYKDRWRLIHRDGGLRIMTRKHVHFAPDVPPPLPPLQPGNDKANYVERGEGQVVSGMRRDATVCVWVDVKKSMRAGMKWWRGENGVILSDGFDGIIPLDFVVWAEMRGGGVVLMGDKEEGLRMKKQQGEAHRIQGPDLAAINRITDLDLRTDGEPAAVSRVVKNVGSTQVKERWDDSRDVSPER